MVLKPRKNIQVFDSCNFFAHHFLSFIKNNFLFTKLKPPGYIHYLPIRSKQTNHQDFYFRLAQKRSSPKSTLFAFETAPGPY